MATHTPLRRRWAGPITRVRRPLVVVAALMVVAWVVPVLLPDDSGWKLGIPFRLFYTVIALLGGLFFVLVESPASSHGRRHSGSGLFVRISAVYLGAVGFLVLIGAVFPNFDTPTEAVAVAQTPADRGEALFFDSSKSCILCHAVAGQGGTRGPDMAGLATRSAGQVAGLSAEDYIRQSILDPKAFIVEPFDPIMPENLVNVVGEENFDDLIAFLMTLEEGS